MRLTALSVEKLKPQASRREIPDDLLPRFYLTIQPSGVKSWVIRYRHLGRPRKMTIGGVSAWPLDQAREEARRLLRLVDGGRDPAQEKAEAKAAAAAEHEDTVDIQFAAFLRLYASRNRSADETERLLRKDMLPAWTGRRVGEIKRSDVVRLLDKVVDRGASFTANRLFAQLRKFGNWLVERGLIEKNFCDGMKAPTAEVQRERVLDDDELAVVWRAAGTVGGLFGDLVHLLVLTSQRREEVAGMRWAEIDLQARTWTIPRERAKNDREHVVPLSERALAIISARPRIDGSAFVFTSNGRTSASGFSKSKAAIDQTIKADCKERGVAPIAPWRLHDLRRTAASGMARLGQPIHVVEALLNHKSGSIRGVAAVYNRYSYAPEKARALDAWAALVEEIVDGKPANVVRLREIA